MHGKQRFKVTAESQRGIVGTVERMTIQRMEHVGIVVDDLAAATAFFVELGLKLQGEGSVEGGWVDRVVGLEGVRSEIAMLETPDGHGRLELSKFHAPSGRGGDRHAPANTPGIRHVTFAVDDIDAAVASVRARGGEGQLTQGLARLGVDVVDHFGPGAGDPEGAAGAAAGGSVVRVSGSGA